MTDRNHEEIVKNIVDVLNEYVAPAVAQHGGVVNFVNFENGNVLVELSGACSGCSGSYFTLRNGVENILKQMVPEVKGVDGIDDPFSTVNPFYTDPFGATNWDLADAAEVDDESNN